MKVSPPSLTPFLRSDTQGRLLAELYLRPDEERTTTELARGATTSLATASKELARLVDSGVASVRRVGRNSLHRVNTDHPLFAPMTEILQYAYGPITTLRDMLRHVDGLELAYIYGSWAARLSGEPGPDPNDIDLLVVGDAIDRHQLGDALDDARSKLRREVNPKLVRRATWEAKEDLFLRHLDERPLVAVIEGRP